MIDENKACLLLEYLAANSTGKIAVYGLGKYAHAVARKISELIYCFCDGVKVDGYFDGKPILPLNELPSIGIYTVVIAAGLSGERIVFERINDFCQRKGISIYGIQSGNLNHVGINESASLRGQKLKKKLWECIEAHDVISFDIFDTLLMRKTLYPVDVFDIVEYRASQKGIDLPPGFKNYRNQAEVACERESVGLAGIYANLQKMLDLSDEDVSILMKLEFDAEREVVYPRQSLVEAGKYAKSLGKRVVLVSDMYLPPAFLEELLSKNGIAFYDKIYVSDYCGVSKVQGLFKIVCKENPADTYLHIGDNEDSDGWGARKQGVDSFLIKSALDIFRELGLNQPFKYLDGYNERLLVGLFLINAFADPFLFNEAGKREVKNIQDFSRLFIAPLAVSFVIWLLNKTREHRFDAILFAARDGYAFKKMYDKAVKAWNLKELSPSIYLYVSRKLCMGLSVRNVADLEWIQIKLQGETKNFVEDVFGLGISSRDEGSKEGSNVVWQDVLKRKKEIYDRSEERCNRYIKYVNKLGLSYENYYAFVDMCSQGTSQRALSNEVFRDLYGLYFKRYNSIDIKNMGKVESFLPQDNSIMMLNNVFEFIFTSPEPSANDISFDGRIVFDDEVRIKDEIRECINAQDSIIKFFEEFLILAIPSEDIRRMIGQQLLELFRNVTFEGAIETFRGRMICNDLVKESVSCLNDNEITIA